ncbi:DUF1707 domain-containing protein [Streptomonospora nanhaiensis]|uniref:DUF1707 SHOCT-like domain-containing protein n=1 Tax=Streptomonospora nanhaiensis TaxID=1323731 RepID=UPI001C9931C3|nr:DUF1707 domain-containing protein [Streptomonospora nanhaiensis]MBX9391200.1 DUF1707 domain-containing protein [Streptomonospora nanhaiensis]
MPQDPYSPPELRASDADRDRTIDLLRAAVADGRLTPAEFDERVDAALAARTVAALAPLTADLVAAPGGAGPLAGTPADPAADLLTIKEKHGMVRRAGPWTLPHRLALRTSWSAVLLDLTDAVRTGPELVIEARVTGGDVDLVLAPDMAVDANELAVRYGQVDIGRNPYAGTPAALRVRVVGRLRHGRIGARWQAPQR